MTGNLDDTQDYQTTLDNLMEGFQLISFDWRYLYVNEAVVKQSKYSKEDLLGSTMMERYPGIENTPMFKTLELCMRERVARNFENTFTFPDQSQGCFELRIQPVPEGIFILSVDITERKLAEKEKTAYINGLEEMIFMTSHNIRQPIAQIMGVSILLENHSHSQEELKKISLYMKQSISFLDNFTKDLTNFIHELKQKIKDKTWL